MSGVGIRRTDRPQPDQVIQDIADYVCDYEIDSELAYSTAHYCLMDSLACSMLAMKFPDCNRLLGPIVPGATLEGGARVPGTGHELTKRTSK